MGTLAILVVAIAVGAQAPAASVSGRITDTASGRPVPRMIVAAVGADRIAGVEAVTDDEGRYEIAGLAAGAYAIRVTHDEHRSTYLSQWFGEPASASLFAVPPRLNVDVKAGERRTGLDIALTRALAIEGQVLDPWGDPLPNVEVIVMLAGKGQATGGATTNDLGLYRIFGLAPGRYRVCADAGGTLPADTPTVARTCYPMSIVEAEAFDVTLTSQDANGIDIRIQRSGGRRISGVVTDAAGLPMDGVEVIAAPSDHSVRGGATSSVGGAFGIGDLAPGRYTVIASIGGVPPGDPNPPERVREVGYATADLVTTDTAIVTVALSKPVTIAGRVVFDAVSAPSSRNLGIRVETRVADAPLPFQSEPAVATVKGDLSFELAGLYRRPLNLMVQGLPDGWALKSIRFGGRDVTYAATDFAATPADRLQVVVTDRVASPSVKPVNERGEAVPAAFVVAVPANPERWALPFARITNAPARGGVQKLGAMLPGDYFVAALPIEDWSVLLENPLRLASLATIGTKVTLAAGDTPLLTLRVVPLPDK